VVTFFQRLDYAVRHSGFSKGALARHLNVPQSSVSRWLKSTYPKAETVAEIAKFLSVDVNWLMTGDSAKAPAGAIPDEEEESSTLHDDAGIFVFTRRQGENIAPPPSEIPVMERLRILEENQVTMQAAIDRLTKLIKGKD